MVNLTLRIASLFVLAALSSFGQGKTADRTDHGSVEVTTPVQQSKSMPLNVYDTKMAPFRALAQLTYEAFERKDYLTSATLAKLLERFWDETEGNVEWKDKKIPLDPALAHKIDLAMDAFIRPIADYGRALTHNKPATLPDPTKFEAAYLDYIETLKSGD